MNINIPIMKKHISSKASVLLLAVLLPLAVACDYDNAFHNTPHPTQGTVSLHIDFPNSYYMKIADYCGLVEETHFRCPQVFAPGNHRLSLFTLPPDMELIGDTIRVQTLEDGTLSPLPGELHGNTASVTLSADDTLSVDLPLKPLTRRLTLKMKLRSGDPDIVDSVEAIITGIAPALDITTLKLHGSPARVRPHFERSGNMLTAELNLLGVFTEAGQQFTIIITATDGQQQTLTRDMTQALSTFNQSTQPLTLDATLELMNDGIPDADITDWIPGGGDEVDAV